MFKYRFTASICSVICTSSAFAAWSVTNLHPAGAVESFAFAADGNRQYGYVGITFGNRRASIWQGSSAYTDLNPTGKNDCRVLGASNGTQVGYANSSGGRWSGSSGTWVDLNPAGSPYSVATGVGGGQISGYASVNSKKCAGYWSGDTFVNLAPGEQSSQANGVAGGQQVGYVIIANVSRASLWTGTAASRVDLHPTGASGSSCLGTTGTRQVGYVDYPGTTHAATWSNTAASFVDLHPAGASSSVAQSANGPYQVGYAVVDDEFRASFWTGTAQSWVDLHASLPADFSSSKATGISSDGTFLYVVGHGYNMTTGRNEALLWKSSAANDTFDFTLNKTSVAGQNSVQGTITMQEAPASATVFTTYDNSSLVNTPPSVTVAAGTTLKNFQITVTAVTSPINTTIYAKRNTTTISRPLTLTPLIPTALSFTPNPVKGGLPTTAKVVINGVAGPGGRTIALFDNSSFATTPSSVVVPAGATSVNFPISTLAVTAQKVVTVTARVSAGEKTGTFRINP